MERITNSVMSIWEDIYFTFNGKNLNTSQKHFYFTLLDDLVIEIAKFDCDEFRTKDMDYKFSKYIDTYLLYVGEMSSTEMFILTFDALIYALNNLIREKEIKEQFEAAANFMKILDIVRQMKTRWIIV